MSFLYQTGIFSTDSEIFYLSIDFCDLQLQLLAKQIFNQTLVLKDSCTLVLKYVDTCSSEGPPYFFLCLLCNVAVSSKITWKFLFGYRQTSSLLSSRLFTYMIDLQHLKKVVTYKMEKRNFFHYGRLSFLRSLRKMDVH